MSDEAKTQSAESQFHSAMRQFKVPVALPPFGDEFQRSQQLQPTIPVAEQLALAQLKREETKRTDRESRQRLRKRRFRLSVTLFLVTLASTTLVGDQYRPLEILMGFLHPEVQGQLLSELDNSYPPPAGQTLTIGQRFWESVVRGGTYSVPLMLILFCHEMGHYLQAVKNRVPASFPFFIPLPIPPLGTMGAVIFQGQGDRKKMFDIAVSGPLAGLVVTLPILYFGIQSSGYSWPAYNTFQFGEPLLVGWLIEFIHGEPPVGMVFNWNGWATAGWVGVFITAMNLLPIGQLDGGHLMYTLVGRVAHWIAWTLILVAVAGMLLTGLYSYVLLLVLLAFTGPRHPPTSNDNMKIGWFRHVLGWLTLSFLLIGFTPQPLIMPDTQPINPNQILQPLQEVGDEIWSAFSSDG